MKKELPHVILELQNVEMEPSSVRKKVRKSPNVTKKLSYMMLKSHNVRIEPLNVRKKKVGGTTKCEKKTVTCDVETAQYEDEIVKYEKN